MDKAQFESHIMTFRKCLRAVEADDFTAVMDLQDAFYAAYYKPGFTTIVKRNIPMKTTKSIAYAYPTSSMAKALGHTKTGCWYVQVTYHDIEGSGQSITFAPYNAEGFSAPDDKDLIAIFKETEGTVCPYFLKYGNTDALKAMA